jgi:predicted porin
VHVKRILSTAMLASLLLPLAPRALEGEVTLYGTLMPFADNARVSGATEAAPSDGATQVSGSAYTGDDVGQRFRLGSGSSHLGFKGGLDLLGEDLQVFFQVENTVSVDAADSPSSWASRNTGVGLKGKFGRVLLGNWDTPYKYPTPFVGAIRGLNSFDNALVGTPGFGVPATTTQSGRGNVKADAAFNRRQGNSVQYWSPELHGFSARVAVSVNESKTAPTPTSPSVSPTLYSGMVGYVKGPLTVRYAYERHQDYFGLSQLGGSAGATTANDASTDEGHLLVAQVALRTGTRLSGMAERLSYENADDTPGEVNAYERWAFYALAQQRLGAHQLWASYGLALRGACEVAGGGACSTRGLGASQLGVGYSYAVGTSFDLYAAYYQLANDRSATYGVVGGPGAVAPGGTTRGLGIGFLYTFSATATAGLPKGL